MARHWIFDLDGTLIDSHPLYIRVFREVADELQVELSGEAWEQLCHIVLPKFLEKYFPADKIETAYAMVVKGCMAGQSEVEVYAGMREVLEHLHAAGCADLEPHSDHHFRSVAEFHSWVKLQV